MLGLIDPRQWLVIALAAACLLLGATAGIQTLRLDHARTELAQEQADREKETAERERVAREAEAKIAALQAQHAAEQQRLTDAYQADLKKQADAAAAARADSDSLQLAVACYAAGDCLGANAPPFASVDWKHRAAVLGRLYRRLDEAAGRYAARADQCGDYARALKQQLMADRAACSPGDRE